MGQKKIERRSGAFRAVFGGGVANKFFLGRENYPNSFGFTLIELIVDIVILSILIVMTVVLIDPARQVGRAKDTQRLHDLTQIKTGLDMYYNDNNCYSNTFSELNSGPVIYVKKIPKDPVSGEDYIYLRNEDCSQWNVLFAKLSRPSDFKDICPLTKLTSCLPADYDSTWACTISGNVDCRSISGSLLIVSTPTPTPTLIPIPTPTPTLAPTPTSCVLQYACRNSGSGVVCNDVGPGNGTYCDRFCNGEC